MADPVPGASQLLISILSLIVILLRPICCPFAESIKGLAVSFWLGFAGEDASTTLGLPHISTMKPTFTIGIEEEYQTIDPETRDLRSHIQAEMLEKGKLMLQERVKAEMHQSVVEVGTGVCKNIKEAKAEVKMLRRDMIRLAKENGLRLASVATHPFADWRMQEINPDDRYKNIVEDMQLVARANLIFGLHVHIGDRGPGDGDPHDEPCAVFFAAYAGALDQFAVLAGDEYRVEVLPLQGV